MTHKPINIAILDDHQIVIDGLKLLLESEPLIHVVMEENNGFVLMEKLAQTEEKVDVLLLDLMMPVVNGDEVAIIMQQKFPDIKIIMLSMSNDGQIVLKLLEHSDIKGYLPKSTHKQALIDAILKVYGGGVAFPEEILDEAEKFAKLKRDEKELRLTEREITIIRLIAQGKTNKEIGAILFISEFTVATHRKNILKKTEKHNMGSLIELANKLKII